jgi:UDP-2-acetamido-3-amino-2,3-dideoxy-glucuronate N-acetyltransferase
VIDPSARIHATAELEADVSIGSGTAVWHRAQLRTGARIGRDAIIGRDVFIDEGVSLGDRVKVQNGALIYHGVTVEDDVFVGPGAILTNDRRPRAVNAVGELARSADWTISPVRIARGASIGAGAIVVAGRDVGPHAMVGAGSVVTHDVPAHALVAGNPARWIAWVCTCGERLSGHGGGAPAESQQAPTSPDLVCPACARQFTYLSAGSGLGERELPRVARGQRA